MGDTNQELQASMKLIWEYADQACLPGSELRPDIEYGKNLLLAAPDLLAACERVLRAINWDDHLTADEQAAILRAAIAKAQL